MANNRSSDSEDSEPLSLKKKAFQFSTAQRRCLNLYFHSGMTGVGKKAHHTY